MRAILVLCAVQAVFGARVRPPSVKLNDGTLMPGIALGTWLGYTSQGKHVEPEGHEIENAVKWAIDAGYRHIDTASVYMVEEQVGRGIAAKISDGTVKREDMYITSKLWNDRHSKEQVIPALRESLLKLGLDYLDLYLIHWPMAIHADGKLDTVTDFVETWQGMYEAKMLNLTKSIGLSNFNRKQIDRILEMSPRSDGAKPAVLQVEINLNLQQPNLLEYAKNNSIVVMGYTPFGSLFPSKAKAAAPPPRIDDQQLVTMAKKYNKTVPQIVLRYLVELGVVPIPKSITKQRIEENIDIFDFTLSEADKNLLRSFDKKYRTITANRYKESPYYPFNDDDQARK